MIRDISAACAIAVAMATPGGAFSATIRPLTPELAERIVLARSADQIAALAIGSPALATSAICEAASLGIAMPADVVRAGLAAGASPDAMAGLLRAARDCASIPSDIEAEVGLAPVPADAALGPLPELALASLDQMAASAIAPKLSSQTETTSRNCELFRVKRHQSAEIVPEEQWTPGIAELFPFILDDSRLLPEFRVAHDWRRECMSDFGVEIGEAGGESSTAVAEREPVDGLSDPAAAPPEDEIETGFPGSSGGIQPITLTNSPPPFVELPSPAQSNPSPS